MPIHILIFPEDIRNLKFRILLKANRSNRERGKSKKDTMYFQSFNVLIWNNFRLGPGKRSSAISKHVSFWAGQIPAGQTSPKGTISEMAARAFYCCLYPMCQPKLIWIPHVNVNENSKVKMCKNFGWNWPINFFLFKPIGKLFRFQTIEKSSFMKS